MLVPWLLIILGLFFLLGNLGIMPPINWPIVWPVILIAVGFFMLKKKMGDSCCGWPAGKKDKETNEEKKPDK